MEITVELTDVYKELVNKIYLEKDSYSEKDLVLFTPGVGKDYNNSLMVIGRAVNGWRIYIDKNNDKSKENIEEVNKRFREDDLQWVIDKWGKGEGYNTNKSAFWRLVKKISNELIEEEESVINKIVWTNLYKLSANEGGNPSTSLINVQLENCKQILKLEFELFKPKVAVFLTGLNWAAAFLKDNDFKPIDITISSKFVGAIGTIGDTLVVVSKHPQGKPEDEHSKEILSAITYLQREVVSKG